MRVVLPLSALILTTGAAPYAPALVPGPLMSVPLAAPDASPPALERMPLASAGVTEADELPPAPERVEAPPPGVTSDGPRLSTRLLKGPPGPGEAVCRDRIHEVREERGLPSLDDKRASPYETLFIAAVDKRIDGCSVMVMRSDTSDVRPLPAMPEGPGKLQRIPGG